MATKKRIYFRYRDPYAQTVSLVGSFSEWKDYRPMKRDVWGNWRTWVALEPGRYEYRFLVDGHWANDPDCSHRAPNAFGSENDVLQV